MLLKHESHKCVLRPVVSYLAVVPQIDMFPHYPSFMLVHLGFCGSVVDWMQQVTWL